MENLYHDFEKPDSATKKDYVSEFLDAIEPNYRIGYLYTKLFATLDYLMRLKIVHMDIKPANLMLNMKPDVR